jgi:hypothetical protein
MGMGHTRTARTLDLCRDGVGLIGTALGDVGQTLLVLFPIGQSSGRVVVESAIGRIIQIHGDEDATYFSVEFQTSLSEATTPNLIRRLLRA